MDTTYQKEYKEFLTAFNDRPVSGAEVGELIAKMAAYFSSYNLDMIHALRAFNRVAKTIELEKDETTGKPISSTKAKVIADATDEAHDYELARAHVVNIEQIINALKAMQRGVLNDYAHQTSL